MNEGLSWKVFKEYEVTKYIVNYVKSYYEGCKKYIRVEGKEGECFEVKRLLSEGRGMSPRLLNIFLDKVGKT